MRRSIYRFKAFILILIGISFAAAYHKMASIPLRAEYAPLPVVPTLESEPVFISRFVSTAKTRIVHAPSIVGTDQGDLLAVWFAGSREGAKDVEIHRSRLRPGTDRWQADNTLITRANTYADTQRYVKKLGNPVITRDPRGKLWMFFVSVSLGGWSCSSINVTWSNDGGYHWSPIRKLITSPFLNISNLVKTVPFYYQDGTMGLPIYHEMFAKFGEILRLDDAGQAIGKTRLQSPWKALQPLVLVQSPEKAVALMRYADDLTPRLAIKTTTKDSGKHWDRSKLSVLPNPDSAMAGVSLSGSRRLVVINNNQQLRDDLTLLETRDNGQHWVEKFRFEYEHQYRGHVYKDGEFRRAIRRLIDKTDANFVAGQSLISAIEHIMCSGHPCWFQFEYPYLIQAKNGRFHLVYTWNQTFIKHIEFNQAWLNQQTNSGL